MKLFLKGRKNQDSNNEMKIAAITMGMLIIMAQPSFSQTNEETPTLLLPVFTAAACLQDLLIAMVEADSNNSKYPPEVFFYELDYQESKDIPSIWITPQPPGGEKCCPMITPV